MTHQGELWKPNPPTLVREEDWNPPTEKHSHGWIIGATSAALAAFAVVSLTFVAWSDFRGHNQPPNQMPPVTNFFPAVPSGTEDPRTGTPMTNATPPASRYTTHNGHTTSRPITHRTTTPAHTATTPQATSPQPTTHPSSVPSSPTSPSSPSSPSSSPSTNSTTLNPPTPQTVNETSPKG